MRSPGYFFFKQWAIARSSLCNNRCAWTGTQSLSPEAKHQRGNVVGVIFDPTPPHLTLKEMRELVDWFDWADANAFKHPLIRIANFIFEYLAIHPFQDGNGRTSRLLTNLLLLKQGIRSLPSSPTKS